MSPYLLIAGLIVFWLACRTFQNRYIHKLGGIAFLGACFCIGYYLGGRSLFWGVFAAGLCFVLPWVEIITRVRKLRMPLRQEMRRRLPPSRESFPELGAITGSIENEGFEEVEDIGLEWEGTRQFVRLMYNSSERTQASIHLQEQEHMGETVIAFVYLSLYSRTNDGKSLLTWDYPFSYPMQFAPDQHVQRADPGTDFHAMFIQHLNLLQKNAGAELVKQSNEDIVGQIERETKIQIDHNLAKGLIQDAGEGTYRYSWRGCFFLWFQLLKDMIRV